MGVAAPYRTVLLDSGARVRCIGKERGVCEKVHWGFMSRCFQTTPHTAYWQPDSD